jgi:hypothetical protein
MVVESAVLTPSVLMTAAGYVATPDAVTVLETNAATDVPQHSPPPGASVLRI